MNNGVVAALQRGVSDLIIVGDSRLAIQQSMGVIACKMDALQVELARHKELTKKLNSVRYLHVVRLYNSAVDSMATEALEAKAGRVVLSLERKSELKALNKIPEMLYTCENSADIRRNSATIRKQSAENSAERTEEPKVTATILRQKGGSPSERRQSVRNEAEFGGAQSQVSNDTAELLTELSEARTPDASDIDLLVVQAERRQRISKAQDAELRWADLKAYLKGEFTQLSHRRVHNAGKVADEFVLSEDGLPYRQTKVRRPEELGDLGLTLRLVVPTTMIDECEPDPLQADWDDIAEKLVHAINNSRDSTRQETLFYLVHGWEARSTLKAMTESIRQGQTNSAETSDTTEWRREANRQSDVALYLAAEFQRKEKARRAKEHNEALSRVEKEAVPRSVESPVESAIAEGTLTESETPEEPSAESPAEATRSLFK
ncbi:unnamed protein product [Phytophthora fragariaefolia]|uniref:Unnamed protein product n=1 Tax=Phytophthora fragariaefolia TaxID=1490495 RepID=A0A9W7CYP4_9STRA|nr:unnamed protein product [Phytophthora fragariaefolia]